MRIASFIHDGHSLYGLVEGDAVRSVNPGFLAKYPTLRATLEADVLAEMPEMCRTQPLLLAQVDLLPPIPAPSKILCVGLNYKKPYPVAGASPQSGGIVIFGRYDDTLVGHGAPLEMPLGEAAQTYDFEGEIVAVIGKTCRHLDAADAMSHVAGYACMNEGSVRGWQKHSIHAGKNFLASGAWGPWLTTIDEAGPIAEMQLIVRVNGIVMQDTMASKMIHDLPKLVAYLSHITQLNPGDVIATGSPDGTGGSRTPTAFLKSGDIVEVDVSRVGILRNPVAAPHD
ncbi:fumarylacetoacetate hydrolase family protein [Roseovarius sp. ZX-A-9]|uniref:fumarylacetoacetate hydrolase family protein n=1 Tax=Roseovarius sp. ZX-A-9 TaxID=3014783 RepID=UPI00232F2A9E|nr:fumarylacetoacetate hydrolase family protein [Roseovarius sp. ZX-A-9]